MPHPIHAPKTTTTEWMKESGAGGRAEQRRRKEGRKEGRRGIMGRFLAPEILTETGHQPCDHQGRLPMLYLNKDFNI